MKLLKKTANRKRVKTPTVLQMEAVECGAAALGSILAYYGKWIPLEELRAECGVSRDGSKASNILKAARGHGLRAQGYRKEINKLHEISLPAILFWNFNHFVVLEGYSKGIYYINDPAQGPRKVDANDFNQSFTGVVLEFEKTEEFVKGGQKPSIISSLRRRLGHVKLALSYVIIASLFLIIPGILVPTYSKVFVDKILVKNMHSWAQPLLLAVLVTAVIRYLLNWLQQRYLLLTVTKQAITSSAEFFRHVFHLPMNFFAQRQTGDIANRVHSNDKVAKLLSDDLATNAMNLMQILFYAVVLFAYDIWLTLLGIVIASINIVALSLVSRKRTDMNKRLLQERGKLMGTTMSGLQMIETLKASGAESDFFAKWAGYQIKVVNAQQHLGLTTSLLNVIPPFLMSINTAAILTVGGLQIMVGQMTLGTLVAFQTLMGSFLTPVNELVQLGSKLQTVKGDMLRLDDVFNHPQDPIFQSESSRSQEDESTGLSDSLQNTSKLSGDIEISNLTFGYNILEAPLIQDFSLKLKPGARVALVGGSGSGKSTIVKVLSGLYQPWEGKVYFDGIERNKIPRYLLANSIGMVDQDIFLFEGSIRDNLTMWDYSLFESQIIQSAKDAGIHTDIASRPNGYDSTLSEGGGNFSGGQRQRIEIARALVHDPSILIMDEATSALDPIMEKTIDENIRRRGCSCIIVAHRLSTIRDCDEILVLDGGKVVQRGTHDQLIQEPGKYNQLIQAS